MVRGIKEVHMLWVYGDFSKLEKICANSFVKHGYQLNIWSYGGLSNAPLGATICDARDILLEEKIFKGRSGSYAQFSDLFRYAVLCKRGGLWADADVVALTPGCLDVGAFLVTERDQVSPLKKLIKSMLGRPEGKTVNNNIIYNPFPIDGNIIQLAYQYASAFPKDKVIWGELGPRLLSAIEGIYPEHEFEIRQPDFSNPVDWWKCPSLLLSPDYQLPSEARFVHLYNETWRRAGVDKNAAYPNGSLMRRFEVQFLY